MTRVGFLARVVSADRTRVVLTMLAIAVTTVALLVLRTVSSAWRDGSASNWTNRIVTRHKVTFAMSLPRRYVEQVRGTAHVRAVTWASWFGGNDPRHQGASFNSLAVDPSTFFLVYDDRTVAPSALAAFVHDKRGALVGDLLARRFGWKVGDKVTLRSGIVPGDWEFTIDGFYTTTSRSADRSTFLLRWDYVNDGIPPQYQGGVGWIVSRVDDPSRAAEVASTIDRTFEEGDTPTLSQDERTVSASFLGMFSAVLGALDAICAAILATITLILGNTIAMGVREWANEYAIMRAVGFRSHQVAICVVAQALCLSVGGTIAGSALAWPLIDTVIGRWVADNFGSLLPSFELEGRNVPLALALSSLAGVVAAAIPAWHASRGTVAPSIRRVT